MVNKYSYASHCISKGHDQIKMKEKKIFACISYSFNFLTAWRRVEKSGLSKGSFVQHLQIEYAYFHLNCMF